MLSVQISAPVRVLLVCPFPLERDGLTAALAAEPGFAVCGQAGSVTVGRELAAALGPAVLVIDPDLPDGDGLRLVEEVREWADPPACVVLSARPESAPLALSALRLGASAFVCKTSPTAALIDAIRQSAGGRAYFTPAIMNQLLRRLGPRRVDWPGRPGADA